MVHISNRGPKAKETWRRPQMKTGFVIPYPAETRHVIDRTLGGDVIYISGRWTARECFRKQCTLADWLDWAADARKVTAK